MDHGLLTTLHRNNTISRQNQPPPRHGHSPSRRASPRDNRRGNRSPPKRRRDETPPRRPREHSRDDEAYTPHNTFGQPERTSPRDLSPLHRHWDHRPQYDEPPREMYLPHGATQPAWRETNETRREETVDSRDGLRVHNAQLERHLKTARNGRDAANKERNTLQRHNNMLTQRIKTLEATMATIVATLGISIPAPRNNSGHTHQYQRVIRTPRRTATAKYNNTTSVGVTKPRATPSPSGGDSRARARIQLSAEATAGKHSATQVARSRNPSAAVVNHSM